jgi:hypothetical protein
MSSTKSPNKPKPPKIKSIDYGTKKPSKNKKTKK